MIYDVFTYNGEKDILDLRLNILYPYVDRFVIVEFDKTFSGRPKSRRLVSDWKHHLKEWSKFITKIDYAYITEEYYLHFLEMAQNSPNVPQDGPAHWKREFMQKESIRYSINDLGGDDLLFLGDVDEIWNPDKLTELIERVRDNGPAKIKLDVYTYYLNNKSSEEFWGTLVTFYRDIKDQSLNHLRTLKKYQTDNIYGWHFTSMGGHRELKSKLTDSYTSDSYASQYVLESLEKNIRENKDFLGRDFSFQIDESNWPMYLKDNKEKYIHLLKA